MYQDFGHVPAENTRIVTQLLIDGRTIANETKGRNAGILSPEVPHYLALHVPNGSCAAILGGRSQLSVEIAARYDRPGAGQLCYLERFVYVADEKRFEVNGGSTQCAGQKILE